MKNKDNKFNEKLCVTASSQDHAHREPVSFVVRRGVAVIIAVVVVCVLALSIYTTVNATLSLKKLQITNEALKQTVEMQDSALGQFEQKIGEMQQTQQSGAPD
jgi:hypothetical protein